MNDPLFRRIRMHAEKRLQPASDEAYPARLARLKEYLRLENQMLQRYHHKGDTGTRVAKCRSIVLDVLLEHLFAHAQAVYQKKHGKLPVAVTLLALGGYGRQELCPFSDIDLMFLYPAKGNRRDGYRELQETLTNEVLYPLWDLGLKVGHSSRNVQEAITEAREDIVTKNSLLEARRIAGDEALFDRFHHQFEKYYLRDNPEAYLETRLDEQRQRRAKLGDTPFLQEPDIKNGVGGLRDYQNILWMARIRLNAQSLQDLVAKKYLHLHEAKDLEQAYDFLLRVRNELHFQSRRPTDVLDLEKQPGVAYALGYRQQDLFKRVETFMRDYYRCTQQILMASKILERQLSVTGMPGGRQYTLKAAIESRRQGPARLLDGFLVQNKVFLPQHTKIFAQDPARIVRLFRHLQQLGGELSLELLVLVRDSTRLLTPAIVQSESVTRSFRSILQTPGDVYPILSQMHELGVLGKVIYEFDELTCLVQHELYHRYTADIHTLNTIRELDAIFRKDKPETAPYLEQLRKTAYPSLLYLILLLHDIGKGRAIEKHAETGAQMARDILKRLGLAAETHDFVVFIIEHHLEMARFWQRFDVEDPRTIASFASLVGNADQLRYLYALTPCDARGTSSSLWNSYKEVLHQKLFTQTLQHLQGDAPAEKERDRIQMIQQDIVKKNLPELSEEEIEAHFSLLPERYFLLNSQEDVELHLQMIHRLLDNIHQAESVGSLVPVIEWRDDIDQSLTVVHVITWDRAGLFYKLAGAFAVAGLNILSTKAISRNDHITIDTFYVVEPGVGPVQNKKARALFEEHIEAALLRNKDLLPEIDRQARKLAKPAYMKTDERLRAPIPPTVDVYHELSLKRTIIEIQANDHLGLLYDISKSIFDHGYDITFARIATERDVAIDTFYIEPIDGLSEPDSPSGRTADLVNLRETLTNIIAQDQHVRACSI